ncbi:hypothetical protein CFK37_17985 [Virgibacillus phasianinus]|uniref:ABC transporter permease n=1 Tax=Virgibacillus phasianinus TaxID=2017483 RepID=A0A220U739_9BACI|nr:ABC transporter permease subunit [Virgibacillus phasianinus]ASK63910.1 hypothetical protein CFK37_17985 [Virgibacillus phasianinus]
MIHVLKREFIDSFKSVRSILIVLFITFVSYQSAKFIENNPGIIDKLIENGGEAGSAYTAAIALIVLMFGFLFVFATSHDIINRETEMKTMRLLVTKTSRWQVMLGKFCGAMLFWVVTVSISFSILSIIAESWFPKDYFQSLLFIFYIVSFVLLISTVITKTKLTMFLGILLGITLPIIGLIASVVDRWYLLPFRYLLPYNYLEGSVGFMLIPMATGIVYILLSIYIIQRRDL